MYLRTSDYDPAIQDVNLQQIISTNNLIRLTAELRAKEEIESYLKGKYDTAREFTDTAQYSPNISYKAGNRFELTGTLYDATKFYLTGEIVQYLTGIYICIAQTPVPAGAFSQQYFLYLGEVYEVWSYEIPYTEFDFYGVYTVGDVVFYKDKIYKCVQPSGSITHTTYLNAITQKSIPATNIFPDDKLNGVAAWGVGVPYSIFDAKPNSIYPDYVAGVYAAGERVVFNGQVWQSINNGNPFEPNTDINWWFPFSLVKKDNRSQRLVEIMVDIVLMKLHQRIAPRNIPELRAKNYAAAMEWLIGSNHGDITPNLLLKQPLQGNRISFGGITKTTNTY